MTEYSVFGTGAPPYSVTVSNDATPYILMGSYFYVVSANGWYCSGGRVWIPQNAAVTGKQIIIGMWANGTTPIDLNDAPRAYQQVTTPANGGWAEAHWEPEPVDSGSPVLIAYRLLGSADGMYITAGTPGPNPVIASSTTHLALAEETIVSLDPDADRSRYCIGGGGTNNAKYWTSTDILVDDGVIAVPAPVTSGGGGSGKPALTTRNRAGAALTKRVWNGTAALARATVGAIDAVGGNANGLTAITALPRIPWEGGPAYYAAFSNAVASGMTSPAFFPLLVDYEQVLDPGDPARDRAYGVNGYYRLSGSDLSYIRAAGMVAFPTGPGPNAGVETVGYNVTDEADMWGGPGWADWNGKYPGESPAPTPNSGYDVMADLVAALPSNRSAVMRHMNYGKGIVFWESDAQKDVFINGGTNPAPPNQSFSLDGVSADLYFYSDNDTISQGLIYAGIPTAQIRRAINYGRHVVRVIQNSMLRTKGALQPVYGFVEVASQGANVAPGDLTDEKVIGAVWACIIYEARGIIYFNHDFVYTGNYHVLRDDATGHKDAVTAVNAAITGLARVLNTQSYVWTLNMSVKSMLKVVDGFAYIFAMSTRQETHSVAARTLVLPPGISATQVQVTSWGRTPGQLSETRTLPVTNGTITDTFPFEYTAHVYKVAV